MPELPPQKPVEVMIRRGGLSSAPDGSARLMSLDALRGFDMFWIAGGGYVVSALDSASDNFLFSFLKSQLTHVDWDGFHFYDLIFPLFVFITGVSSAFSLGRLVEQHGRFAALRRIFWRGLLLVLLGIFYSGGASNTWPDIRLLGVLQRIGLAYTGAGFLAVFLRPRWLTAAFFAILVGYSAALEFVPIRNIRLEPKALEELKTERGVDDVRQLYLGTISEISGVYEKGYNLVNHFDYRFLPGRLYDTYWDPEGILSTFPAIATCLLGILAGSYLRREDQPPANKTFMLMLWGLFAVVSGFLLSFQQPVIKKIWSPTFVLVAGGYSLLLLAAFYHVVDVRRNRAWCQPFVWIGMNSIVIYFASQLLNFRKVAERLVGGTIKAHLGSFGDVVLGLVAVTLMLLFARALFRRKLFLRL